MNKTLSDLISYITINAYFSNLQPVPFFFKDTFFVEKTPQNTTTICLDTLLVGSRKLAPFVSSNLPGVVITKDGGKSQLITAPYINEISPISAQDIQTRVAGTQPFIGSGGNQLEKLIYDNTERLRKMRDRTIEHMAAQAIIDGRISVKGSGVDYTIDYGRDSELTTLLTSGVYWGTANSKPMQDLRSMRRKITQKSGVVPNVLIMGYEAFALFLKSEEVKEQVSRNRMGVSYMEGRVKGDGSVFYMNIAELGDIYGVEGSYVDSKGIAQDYIKPFDVVYATRGVGELHYGAICNTKVGGFAPLKEFIFIKDNDYGKGSEIVLESSPCPIAFVNASAKITVGA